MSQSITILIVYAIFLVAYASFLIQQAVAFKAKYGYLCEASGLGTLKNRLHIIYNVGYFLFGILSLLFSFILKSVLVLGWLTDIGVLFLYVADISLCFVAIFPADRYVVAHTISSISLFLGTLLSLAFLIYPFYITESIPNSIILLNGLIILFLSYYIYLKVKNISEFGLDNESVKKISIWEWLPFMMTFLWSFILTLVLIF